MTLPNMGAAHHQPKREARQRRRCHRFTPAPGGFHFHYPVYSGDSIYRGEAASVLQGAKVAAEAKALGRSMPRSGTTKQNGGSPALVFSRVRPGGAALREEAEASGQGTGGIFAFEKDGSVPSFFMLFRFVDRRRIFIRYFIKRRGCARSARSEGCGGSEGPWPEHAAFWNDEAERWQPGSCFFPRSSRRRSAPGGGGGQRAGDRRNFCI